METKTRKANVRDEELAFSLIDEHVYKEDVDESTVPVKTDKVTRRSIKDNRKQKEGTRSKQAHTEIKNDTTATNDIPNTVTSGQYEKGSRWKFVAKVVNTRAMKKKGRKSTLYTNNNMENTLVEKDGLLRVATVDEAKKVAWKPTRTKGTEYIYEGVQKAWLKKNNEGDTGVWGKGLAPKTAAADTVTSEGTQ